MRLYVVCRSVGSENTKNRPEFYSKTLALASLLRAVENVGIPTQVVFANDGPIPEERLSMMSGAGEVLPIRCGSNRSSYRYVLRLPRTRGWAHDDLVWFAEDDYLYSADALSGVVAAAEKLPEADYFTVYSELRFAADATRRRPTIASASRADGDEEAVSIGRARWYHAVSSTSTYGAWVHTILADERLLRTTPFVGGAFDHATCMAYQGYRPFGLSELGGEPLDPDEQAPTVKRAARRVALTGVRGALNVVALARPEYSRRVLVAPDPDLATHLEAGHLAPGTDWAAEARAVEEWLRAARR
ncbi:hypothetical protein I6A84_14075 [Frankia sp. CNm7]|uniref:Uncharacterized protein n=1 Tax=Frankia nepalensis TaxID=1836974 RepID=A0A937RRB2_9ACTN|nr:hypothetical protein [Frankia nepalensis]MBL7495999.1 hypothetical protein [Frankia nepalensis]MBL7514971.1 hypothetical protein [Frankia nepalensis]MBL7519202.1 hypothetical protein [Frankia nepalensis]MBL7633454.1 hypothetical protein [Frankia nepalensis]